MTMVWTVMAAAAVLWGSATGRGEQVAAAAMEGAGEAVELALALAGPLCLWSGVMEVMEQSGLSRLLSRLLRPILRRLFPEAAKDREAMDSISANVSANLLGLGNAATPFGVAAARQLAAARPGVATDGLCMLVVCNTASIQLLPTTVAALRAAAGCRTPFDLLPAVWTASALSVLTGILVCRVCAVRWGR